MDVLTRLESPEPLIEVPETKAFLRLTDDDTATINDDPLIASLIETATAYLDGEDGRLGRCLGRQKWRLTLDAFPVDGIEVPLPPLVSVDAVAYLDASGAPVPLDRTAYRVAIPGAAPGLVRPVGRWPVTAPGPAAVTVEFTAGYEKVPAPIVTAILQHVALLYENRETAAYGSASFQTVPFAGEALIEPYVRPFFG